MYGLIDCNNFYVSCERVFNPALNNIPVVVLSNNDGCIIARSNEAKKCGIKMGVPFFEVKDLIKKYNIKYCSTNFTLYSDMSDRVMTILAEHVPYMEIYSVDEAFLHLEGILNLDDYSRNLVDTVSKSTGIPVSLGVAPTKTLAKIANFYAKKYKGYKQLCIIDSEEKRIKALQLMSVGEVWGIGRNFKKTLQLAGIKTAYDLTQKSRSWIRKKMSVIGERIWLELQGTPCIGKDEMIEKKQICTTRSFGYPINSFEPLLECIVNFASFGTAKLRKQNCSARSATIFAHTGLYGEKDSYTPVKTVHFPNYTSDIWEITPYCREALKSIYREGYIYRRGGVIFSDVIPDRHIPAQLFDTIDREKQQRLLNAFDNIAIRNGRDAIHIATQGEGYLPHVKQEYLSNRYSTNWNEIIEIKV